jgi:hypothetical protein
MYIVYNDILSTLILENKLLNRVNYMKFKNAD